MNNLLKKIAIFLGCISLMQITIYSQNEIDAFRFSEIDWQGSARFMGAGKAFGAVGAEFSALNINPAAIGLYKKSEITFTPLTLSIYKNNSDYNGSSVPAQAIKYNLGSAGAVFALPGISSTLWKKFQIGFGFNRIKNYNNTFSMEGRSNGKTIGSEFALATNGINYEDINYLGIEVIDGPNVSFKAIDEQSALAWVAWESYFIDPVQGSKTQYEAALKGRDLLHSSTTTRTGGNDEMFFSFGTNYDDKLFMGATIGIPFINFTENRTFIESNDRPDTTDMFRSFTITDKLSVKSTGINLKLGIIYQPVDFLRVGLAFHTPTYYGKVKDNFNRRILGQIVGGNRSVDYSVEENSYALTTPLRATANVAFFIAQRAFISAEYEFANYGSASMYSNRYNFKEENEAVQDRYGFCHIARIGAEINISQVFSLRAGYNYISSPYKDKITDGSQHYASAGLGFRTQYFFGDFAYAFNICKEKYWMYDPAFVNATDNKFITHRVMLTLGVRF